MIKKINVLILCVIIIYSSLISVGVSIKPAPIQNWTCYDYSINYSEQNLEWKIVTISDNQFFDSNIGF